MELLKPARQFSTIGSPTISKTACWQNAHNAILSRAFWQMACCSTRARWTNLNQGSLLQVMQYNGRNIHTSWGRTRGRDKKIQASHDDTDLRSILSSYSIISKVLISYRDRCHWCLLQHNFRLFGLLLFIQWSHPHNDLETRDHERTLH